MSEFPESFRNMVNQRQQSLVAESVQRQNADREFLQLQRERKEYESQIFTTAKTLGQRAGSQLGVYDRISQYEWVGKRSSRRVEQEIAQGWTVAIIAHQSSSPEPSRSSTHKETGSGITRSTGLLLSTTGQLITYKTTRSVDEGPAPVANGAPNGTLWVSPTDHKTISEHVEYPFVTLEAGSVEMALADFVLAHSGLMF